MTELLETDGDVVTAETKDVSLDPVNRYRRWDGFDLLGVRR